MGLQSRLFFPIGSELQGLTRNQDSGQGKILGQRCEAGPGASGPIPRSPNISLYIKHHLPKQEWPLRLRKNCRNKKRKSLTTMRLWKPDSKEE